MNKQIEERHDLTEIIYMSGYGLLREDCICLAEQIQEQGYRRQDEVAREIIADLVKFADDNERQGLIKGHSVWFIDADDMTDFIAELKKKYGVTKE